jgi:tetratricopeptide (TPR) repeat protein
MSADYLDALNAIVQLTPAEPYEVMADRYIALIALQPQRAEAYQSLALYAGLCGQIPAAQYVIDEALKLPTGLARSHYIKARIADEAMDPELAVAHYGQALQLEPGNTKWRFNLGLAQLTLGDFEHGAALYRQRFSSEELAALGCTPNWEPNSASRKVLLWAEQGLGDELMFARLLPCLQGYACHFTLQCDQRLISTFRLNHPWLEFIPRGELAALLPGFDAQLAIGDLLALFHRELANPAVRDCVLKPVVRTDILPAFSSGMGPKRSRVGISWLSMNKEYGAQRSVPIERLLDAFAPSRHVLVNLQYLAPPEHLQAIRKRGFELIDRIDALNDIEGLAALAAQCDAIVSIDNSTLHLAGAMGFKPCALIPRLPNWRWLLQTTRSPWYPSMELLRQGMPFDWSAEVETLRLRFSAGA